MRQAKDADYGTSRTELCLIRWRSMPPSLLTPPKDAAGSGHNRRDADMRALSAAELSALRHVLQADLGRIVDLTDAELRDLLGETLNLMEATLAIAAAQRRRNLW